MARAKEEYGKSTYWDERYAKTDWETEQNRNFDWYRSYEELEELLSNHCHFNDSVLVLGCGNSRISEFLAPKVKAVKNVDISEQVIARMQEQYSDESYHENVRSMTWSREDVTQMKLGASKYDILFDKACFDSVLCSQNSREMAPKMLGIVSEALNSGGKYICVSHAKPEYRLGHFDTPDLQWDKIDSVTLEAPAEDGPAIACEGSIHYLYILTKKRDSKRLASIELKCYNIVYL